MKKLLIGVMVAALFVPDAQAKKSRSYKNSTTQTVNRNIYVENANEIKQNISNPRKFRKEKDEQALNNQDNFDNRPKVLVQQDRDIVNEIGGFLSNQLKAISSAISQLPRGENQIRGYFNNLKNHTIYFINYMTASAKAGSPNATKQNNAATVDNTVNNIIADINGIKQLDTQLPQNIQNLFQDFCKDGIGGAIRDLTKLSKIYNHQKLESVLKGFMRIEVALQKNAMSADFGQSNFTPNGYSTSQPVNSMSYSMPPQQQINNRNDHAGWNFNNNQSRNRSAGWIFNQDDQNNLRSGFNNQNNLPSMPYPNQGNGPNSSQYNVQGGAQQLNVTYAQAAARALNKEESQAVVEHRPPLILPHQQKINNINFTAEKESLESKMGVRQYQNNLNIGGMGTNVAALKRIDSGVDLDSDFAYSEDHSNINHGNNLTGKTLVGEPEGMNPPEINNDFRKRNNSLNISPGTNLLQRRGNLRRTQSDYQTNYRNEDSGIDDRPIDFNSVKKFWLDMDKQDPRNPKK